ncbi:MAG: hypothetical protein R2737_02610 [Candidatus Nanopelagicales bacterium]
MALHRTRAVAATIAAVTLAAAPVAAGDQAPAGRPGTVQVTGRVVTADGAPVPGVQVIGYGQVTTRTDADGGFRLRVPDRERVAVVFGRRALAAGTPNTTDWIAEFDDGLAGPPSRPKTLRLPPVMSYRIGVLDDAGRPVPGARVTASASVPYTVLIDEEDDGQGTMDYEWDVSTGGDGIATVRTWSSVRPRNADAERAVGEHCTLHGGFAWPRTTGATVRLPAGDFAPVVVSGRVVAPNGAPAGGIAVRGETTARLPDSGVSGAPRRLYADCSDRTTAGEDGTFSLTRAGRDESQARITVSGSPATEGVPWAPDSTGWSVRLPAETPPEGSVTGPSLYRLPPTATTGITVRSQTGRPASRALVRIATDDGYGSGGWIASGDGVSQSPQTWAPRRLGLDGRLSFRTWRRSAGDARFELTARLGAGPSRARAVMEGLVPRDDATAVVRLGPPGGPVSRWGEPSPPRGLTLERRGTTLVLRWRPAVPNQLPLSGYVVGGPGARPNVWVPPTATSFTVRRPTEDDYCVSSEVRDDQFGEWQSSADALAEDGHLYRSSAWRCIDVRTGEVW